MAGDNLDWMNDYNASAIMSWDCPLCLLLSSIVSDTLTRLLRSLVRNFTPAFFGSCNFSIVLALMPRSLFTFTSFFLFLQQPPTPERQKLKPQTSPKKQTSLLKIQKSIADVSKKIEKQTTQINKIGQNLQSVQKQVRAVERQTEIVSQIRSQVSQIQGQLAQVQKNIQKRPSVIFRKV